jgi:hypothetical protein
MTNNQTIKLEAANKPIMISIDWDFFMWNGGTSERPEYYNRNGKRIDSREVFCWDGSEEIPAQWIQEEWLRRHAFALKMGIDIEAEMDIRTERGCVEEYDFVLKLEDMFKFINITPKVYYCETHTFAFHVAKNLALNGNNGDPIRIVHFDSHHDLGYAEHDINNELKKGYLQCGSWLYHAINRGYCDHVDIVYPDWVGLYEWNQYKNMRHIEQVRNNITLYTWTQWLNDTNKSIQDNTHDIIIARSDPWSPPWLDNAYDAFVGMFNYDQHYIERSSKCDGLGIMLPREWNYDI